MKRMVVLALGLALLAAAAPAPAHVVEVTTTVPLAGVAAAHELRDAVASAVRDILEQTIAFTPTVVTVTGARVMGEHLLVRLLIMDAEGERMLETLAPDVPDDPETAGERLTI